MVMNLQEEQKIIKEQENLQSNDHIRLKSLTKILFNITQRYSKERKSNSSLFKNKSLSFEKSFLNLLIFGDNMLKLSLICLSLNQQRKELSLMKNLKN